METKEKHTISRSSNYDYEINEDDNDQILQEYYEDLNRRSEDELTQLDEEPIVQLFKAFEKGYKTRIVGNEHLIYPIFHQVLSVICGPVRYIFGGIYKNVNISTLKIQQSGTGKGEADKYCADVLRYLGYRVKKVNNCTEAGIIGTVGLDKQGKVLISYGALKNNDFVWFDEARTLFIGNQFSAGLLETINGYLDDGCVSKIMAKGNLEYSSNCIIGTGTFFFEKIPSIMKTGIAQRFQFVYKQYTSDDLTDISAKFDRLASKNFIADFKPEIDAMIRIKKKININKYKKSTGNGGECSIEMGAAASSVFGKAIDEFFNKELKEVFNKPLINNQINSFLIRSKVLGHKIMALYSVCNGEDKIGVEAARYAIPHVKAHLSAVGRFIEDVYETTDYCEDSVTKESIISGNIRITKATLKKIISNKPGICKTDVYDIIRKRKNKFNLSGNRTIRLLQEMINNGEVGEKSRLNSDNYANRPKKCLFIPQ